MQEALDKALSEYSGKDIHGEPKAEYIRKIFAMDDEQLFKECKNKIWLSAYANNNPRSDFHWQCDACYDASAARDGDKAEIYSRAYKAVAGE